MINHCSVYRKDTGEIVSYSYFSCPDDPDYIQANLNIRVAQYGEEDHAFVASESDPAIHYINLVGDTPSVVLRPPIPYVIDKTTLVAGTGDFVTITGLHNPCTIVVDDPDPAVATTTHVVEDGGFEFEPETPGVYIIEISRFPFLPATIEITAT
jgi:hypothetical protein